MARREGSRRERLVIATTAAVVVGVAAVTLGRLGSSEPTPEGPQTSAGNASSDAPPDAGSAHSASPAYDEPFRPQFHYSPERGWMNDPNGLVLVDETYHFFYQYNPDAPVWGNISWGHATSRDLVHWQELPVAIRGTPEERIFSGSVVLDSANTSGLGTAEDPPLVALYTSWYEATSGHQAQSVAYSTDDGSTWSRYAGNPVLTAEQVGRDPREFRDPKVFWDDRFDRWVMVVAYPLDRQIGIFASRDLLAWEHLSDFGPAGATGGVWECPDLFELPVEGDPARTRWVLSVSLNPGGPNGGSGAQYFVGDFDGRTFTADAQPPERPGGEVLADFDGSYPAGWTTSGRAFGTLPARGTRPGQTEVTGFSGSGLASSFLPVDGAAVEGGDLATGVLSSPPWRIAGDYLSFLVGGGAGGDTAVQLVVDGKVVRRASGTDSEELSWVSWHVADLRGRTARIRLVDRATGSWGHVLADEFVLGEEAAARIVEGGRWQDYGRDYYAVVSWSGTPTEERTVVAWMSNWQYANDLPTHPWRSAATLPRILGLRTVDGRPTLVQEPVRPVSDDAEAVRLGPAVIQAGPATVVGEHPATAHLVVELDLSRSQGAGLELLAGDSAMTVIGYDKMSQELYVDRTRSGQIGFHPSFPSLDRAPLVVEDGRLSLEIFIDHSSVEVFAEGGLVTMTEQVFPAPGSQELRVFSHGGPTTVDRLAVRRIQSSW